MANKNLDQNQVSILANSICSRITLKRGGSQSPALHVMIFVAILLLFRTQSGSHILILISCTLHA